MENNVISAKQVFVVTSFYNVLRQTMTVFFPQGEISYFIYYINILVKFDYSYLRRRLALLIAPKVYRLK